MPRDGRFANFLRLWFGQLVSTLGSGLTGFGLGVWVYQKTHSPTQFALIALAAALPGILVAPLTGALVDRWDRRWIMILADLGAGIGTLALALLLYWNHLEMWHIYVITAWSAIFTGFQWPAFSASVSLMVPKEHYGRASGLTQIGEALAMIASPALAGALILKIGLHGIIIIDFATFLFAVTVTLLLVRVPKPPRTEEGKQGKGSIWTEAAYGWRYIRERKGLLGLLLFFLSINFCAGLVNVLYPPLVLNFNGPAILGMIMSAGGAGLLVGTLVMSAWGGPNRKVNGVLLVGVGLGACLMLTALPPLPWILCTLMVAMMFGLPIINGCSQAIWMSKVAPDVQGRVFSVRRMIAWFMTPIAYALSGPLVDKLLTPAFGSNGALTGVFGGTFGGGQGAAIRFMFLLAGVLTVIVSTVAFMAPAVRNVESDLPDAFPDSQPILEPA